MWLALLIIVIVVGVYVKFKDDKWHEKRGIKRNQDKPRTVYHDDEYDDDGLDDWRERDVSRYVFDDDGFGGEEMYNYDGELMDY